MRQIMIVPLLGSTLDECCKITVNEKCQETVQTLKKKKKKKKKDYKNEKEKKDTVKLDKCCMSYVHNANQLS